MSITPYPTAEAQQALLARGRADGAKWIGEHAESLAEIAYWTGVSGASFESVTVTIQMEAAQRVKAVALFPEIVSYARSERLSSAAFDTYVAPRAVTGRTFAIHFTIETERTPS